MEETREVERKFEADLPVAPEFGGLGRLGAPVVHRLIAVYHDTLGLDLTRAGWVLRHRTGGTDPGWHIKRPVAADERVELHWPLSPSRTPGAVPDAVRREAPQDVRSRALVPVAVLSTMRREHDLLDASGLVLAHLCFDAVTAEVVRAAEGADAARWQEIEVELASVADPGLLDALEVALVAAGARRAPYGSKIARALAGIQPFAPPTTPDAPAADVLLDYFADQVAVLQSREEDVRVDAPDAVHRARVATRRLRSALKTFAPLLDVARTEALRGELRWLGEMLGAPRDAEVLGEEFGDLLAEFDAAELEGPVRARLLGHLADRHTRSHAALVVALGTRRHADLSADLARLLVVPPFVAAADAPAREAMPLEVHAVTAEVRRLRDIASSRPADLERWHDVRKAAKAVRYCTEALARVFGAPMDERARAWTAVTESLGTFQDAVVAGELIGHVRDEAAAAGEPTRTYDVLADAQTDRRDAALAEGQTALEAALEVSAGD